MESLGVAIEILTQLTTVSDIRATQSGLHDILSNLILNAVDALPDGGTITIATSESNGRVIIQVGDTGSGMDEETRRRVFEPFFTTKMDVGTGLGLFTVHGEINGWEGSIDLTSTQGKGTTFTIELPAWLAPQTEPPHNGDAGRLHLVIDDEDIVRDVVFHELSDHHHVSIKTNPVDALKDFENKNYHIAFIDLGLSGTPGNVLAQKFKEKNPTVVTIIMTGWMLDEDDSRFDPFDFRLQKPLEINDLHRTLELAIQLHKTRHQALIT